VSLKPPVGANTAGEGKRQEMHGCVVMSTCSARLQQLQLPSSRLPKHT
jgi:hypothetical protein